MPLDPLLTANLEQDASDLAEIVNGPATQTVVTRLGQPVKTVAKVLAEIETNGVIGTPGDIGTFAGAGAAVIAGGLKLVQVSGTNTAGDTGAGRTFVEDAGVTDAFVTANPLISFRAGGRGFREIDPVTGAKIVPFVLVIAGQSNAVGANAGGPNPASIGVQTWDAVQGEWGGSDYTAAPWTYSTPDGNASKNNYALAAAHRIYEETRRPVYIIFDATSGTSIDAWIAAGTASVRYAALKTKVQAALATAELTSHGITEIDALIWAQGEEDGIDPFATHKANLTTFDTQLRAESWVGTDTPVFAMGMSNLHDRYEASAALREFAGKEARGWRYISTKGLPTSDSTHFTGPAYWQAGYNRLGSAIVYELYQGEEADLSPFYNRGGGRLKQSDSLAIATFDSLYLWGNRTQGPALTQSFSGNGSTTAFTFVIRGQITGVTVGGVAKNTPADYSVAGQTITFTSPPAAGASNIVLLFGGAINAPLAVGTLCGGFQNFADANYGLVGGYQNIIDNGAQFSTVGGRGNILNAGASYGAAFGQSNQLDNTYQFATGFSHVLKDLWAAAVGAWSKYITAQADNVLFQVGIGTSSAARKNGLAVRKSGIVEMENLPVYADNAAAVAGGLLAGQLYRTAAGNVLVRV